MCVLEQTKNPCVAHPNSSLNKYSPSVGSMTLEKAYGSLLWVAGVIGVAMATTMYGLF